MATGNFVLDKGYSVGDGETILKFHAVKYSQTEAETVLPVTSAEDNIAGFAQFDVTPAEATRGKGASVRVQGITEAVAAGAIGLGDQCQLEADGRVSKATTGGGNRVVGQCVGHASTNAGDRISMEIIKGELTSAGVAS